MTEGKYSLRYTPGYEEDLNEIADYVVLRLRNPNSAMKLINKIEIAILERLNCPLSFEAFQSNRKRQNPYYRIYVDSFVVYYVVVYNAVIGHVMEVRRVLYKGRNAAKQTK